MYEQAKLRGPYSQNGRAHTEISLLHAQVQARFIKQAGDTDCNSSTAHLVSGRWRHAGGTEEGDRGGGVALCLQGNP